MDNNEVPGKNNLENDTDTYRKVKVVSHDMRDIGVTIDEKLRKNFVENSDYEYLKKFHQNPLPQKEMK